MPCAVGVARSLGGAAEEGAPHDGGRSSRAKRRSERLFGIFISDLFGIPEIRSSFLGIVELTCDFESMTQQRCPTGDFCWENIAPDQHTDITSTTIINAKQGFEGSLISRNVELSPQKPLKWSCDLQGWSVEEQYINRARSESRLTTMTSFETNLKKD